jgi:hypothetical protein
LIQKREIEGADVARRIYVTLGRPSQDVFESTIHKGSIINNPVTITNYRNALRIYGKDLGSIKGKTTRTKPQHVQVILLELISLLLLVETSSSSPQEHCQIERRLQFLNLSNKF